jgi:hypothetical protein
VHLLEDPRTRDIWACDFVPVVTLFFQTVYAFVIIHRGSRRLVHVNATNQPTDAWVAQQLREATPFGEQAKHLICDNDTKYGPAVHDAAKPCGLDVIHTPYAASSANAIGERFVGSLRRECLDHVLVLGDLPLVRVLGEYSGYFNGARPHTCTCAQVAERVSSAGPTDAAGQPGGPSEHDHNAKARSVYVLIGAGPRCRPQARCCAGPEWSSS